MGDRPYSRCPARATQSPASEPQESPSARPFDFVCAAGPRSKLAAQLATALGFKEVYNVSGGTQAWRAAGLELVIPRSKLRAERCALSWPFKLPRLAAA